MQMKMLHLGEEMKMIGRSHVLRVYRVYREYLPYYKYMSETDWPQLV